MVQEINGDGEIGQNMLIQGVFLARAPPTTKPKLKRKEALVEINREFGATKDQERPHVERDAEDVDRVVGDILGMDLALGGGEVKSGEPRKGGRVANGNGVGRSIQVEGF